MGDIKQFLQTWCGKRQMTPKYDYRAAGPKHRQRFICECRLDNYDYTAVGNSTSKQDSKTNAAKDMIQYLIRMGHVKEHECPELSIPTISQDDGAGADGEGGLSSLPSGANVPPHLQGEGGGGRGMFGGGGGMFGGGSGFNRRPEAPFQQGEGPSPEYLAAIETANRKEMEDAEEADFTASLHGNWTIENAKSRLHQFLQMLKIKTDYKYNMVGPDHNRTLVMFQKQYKNKLEYSVCISQDKEIGRDHSIVMSH